MSTKFPTLIEFIDEMGLDELHATHRSYVEECDEISFSDFVKEHYEACRQIWEDDMNCVPRSFIVPFNEDNDITLESAKVVMKDIINDALMNKKVREIILENELAPNYESATMIVFEFRRTVLPAIEKALNELGA
jgi:hypothetical protein